MILHIYCVYLQQITHNMINQRPTSGIATDAAHSTKNNLTEYQAVDVSTNQRLFYRSIGNQTVNIGEFLAVVQAAKYIIENGYEPRLIWTDSQTAISWWNNKHTASAKKNNELIKAEIFLKCFAADVDTIEVKHWDNRVFGETPADFGRK